MYLALGACVACVCNDVFDFFEGYNDVFDDRCIIYKAGQKHFLYAI